MRETIHYRIFQRFALWRAVVFFCLFSFAGCNKDNLIGLEVQPDGYLDSLQMVDSFSVVAYTIPNEAERSTRYQNFVGRMHNGYFGWVEASLFINFDLESENIALELPVDEYIIDSVVFTIWPISVYGNPQDIQTLAVFAVEEEMPTDSLFRSDRSFMKSDLPLTTKTIGYSSSEEVNQLISDTNFNGLRFHLGTELGQKLLEGIGTEYTSSEAFRSYFPGIAIGIIEGPELDGGAIYNFAVTGAGTGMTLYYHFTDPEDNETQVNVALDYDIKTSNTRHNVFSHDISGSYLENYMALPRADQSLLFTQGMSGVKSKIELPTLSSFARENNIALHKATLSVELADQQPAGLSPSNQLFLLDYEFNPTTGDTLESLTLDFVSDDSRHGGILDEATGLYTFDITRQVQKIIESAQQGVDVNLGFSLTAQVPLLNGNVRQQNVLKGSDNIEFKLYYTDLSE